MRNPFHFNSFQFISIHFRIIFGLVFWWWLSPSLVLHFSQGFSTRSGVSRNTQRKSQDLGTARDAFQGVGEPCVEPILGDKRINAGFHDSPRKPDLFGEHLWFPQRRRKHPRTSYCNANYRVPGFWYVPILWIQMFFSLRCFLSCFGLRQMFIDKCTYSGCSTQGSHVPERTNRQCPGWYRPWTHALGGMSYLR